MNFSSWFEYKNTKVLTYFNESFIEQRFKMSPIFLVTHVKQMLHFIFELARSAYQMTITPIWSQMWDRVASTTHEMFSSVRINFGFINIAMNGEAGPAGREPVSRACDVLCAANTRGVHVRIESCIRAVPIALYGPLLRCPYSAAFMLQWLLHRTRWLLLG